MKRKLNASIIIYVIYCLILIWLVLFKFTFSFEDFQWLQTTRRVNLIPFYYDTDVGHIHAKEVIMNAFVFVPMGLYLKMLTISGKKAVLIGAAGSLAFEVIQFVFAIGASDITDIITNTLGTVVGVCLYALLRKVFADKEKTDRFINRIAVVALVLFGIVMGLLILAN